VRERQVPTSSVLLADPRRRGTPGASDRSKMGPPGQPRPLYDSSWDRGSALTVIAGVGVLLLQRAVGVLIGRAGKLQDDGGAQVISVASTTPGTSSTASSETPLAETGRRASRVHGAAATLAVRHDVSAVEARRDGRRAPGAPKVSAR